VQQLEVLLLRRSEHASFVPGGYVFPGGVVEASDASADVTALIDGISADALADRLRLRDADPPATAYLVAAVRETFEESGLLVGVRPELGVRPATLELRSELHADLLGGRVGFVHVLSRLGARIAVDDIAYFAHWITPERAPRRYDTRFFAALVISADEPILDTREMTDALWITPSAALQAFGAGSMKMILPTIRTLEQLATFPDSREALAAMKTAEVTTILPTSESGGFAARPEKPRLAQP